MARASPPTAFIRAMHPGMVVRPSARVENHLQDQMICTQEAEHENLTIRAPGKGTSYSKLQTYHFQVLCSSLGGVPKHLGFRKNVTSRQSAIFARV